MGAPAPRPTVDEWMPLPTEHHSQGRPHVPSVTRTFVAVVPLPEHPLRWDAHLVLFRRTGEGEPGDYAIGRLDHDEDEQRSFLHYREQGLTTLSAALVRFAAHIELAVLGQDGR